jgi:hypothetical protein
MTTREEYAQASLDCEFHAQTMFEGTRVRESFELAARVLRALADGAVLCSPDSRGCWFDQDNVGHPLYRTLKAQP